MRYVYSTLPSDSSLTCKSHACVWQGARRGGSLQRMRRDWCAWHAPTRSFYYAGARQPLLLRRGRRGGAVGRRATARLHGLLPASLVANPPWVAPHCTWCVQPCSGPPDATHVSSHLVNPTKQAARQRTCCVQSCSSRMTYLYSTLVPAGSSTSTAQMSPGFQEAGTCGGLGGRGEGWRQSRPSQLGIQRGG